MKRLSTPPTSPPPSNSSSSWRRVCNNIQSPCYRRNVLIVHRPCVPDCIGKSTATAASGIGWCTCTRFNHGMLLFHLKLQFGRGLTTSDTYSACSQPNNGLVSTLFCSTTLCAYGVARRRPRLTLLLLHTIFFLANCQGHNSGIVVHFSNRGEF